MGYDLHITRKEDWSDEYSDDMGISLSEWLSYIDTDPELELSDGYWVKVPTILMRKIINHGGSSGN